MHALGDERERKLEELFLIAADLVPEEREGFFRRHCGDDAELRAELEALLAEDEQGTKDFLRSPVLDDEPPNPLGEAELAAEEHSTLAGPPSSSADRHPARIGNYRLLEIIGEGGMGTVYLAEQERPVRRRVAFKIVKLGMDTRRVIQRFENERQALALMEHPGIARIYDAGATDRGRPFFVMEYAPGQAITEFCKKSKIGVRARLELFAKVCDAVQHAHQKGIVHRDLKPSNVLVTVHEELPTPKVIDFGIACATTPDLEERTRHTRESEIIGTFHYMSPEQAEGLDVDTRTDIYSLGVLLYELLTGVLPFTTDDLRGMSISEVRTLLREVDPAKPSVRLARDQEPTPYTRRLVKKVSGDLDWITAKAMGKNRSRRYATASEFAADVRRYLQREPVLAGPPDVSYRISKFIHRNRVAVVSGALFFLVLVAGVIGTTWGMLKASQRTDEALFEQRKAEVAREIATRSEAEALRAKENESQLRREAVRDSNNATRVTQFFVDTIGLADPEVSRNFDIISMLKAAAGKLEGEEELRGFPRGEALLRLAIGRALHSTGQLDMAQQHLERALVLFDQDDGTPRDVLYGAMDRLAQVYRDADTIGSRELGERAARLGTEIVRASWPDVGQRLTDLLDALEGPDTGATIGLLESTNRALERVPPGDDAWGYVADVYEVAADTLGHAKNKFHQAVVFAHDVVKIRQRELPEGHLKVAISLCAYAEARSRNFQHALARPQAERAIGMLQMAYPNGHWLLSEAKSQLGECLSVLGDLERAEELLVQAHQEIQTQRRLESRASLSSLRRLVEHYDRAGEIHRARQLRDDVAGAFAFSGSLGAGWGPQRVAFPPRADELVAAVDSLHALVELGSRVHLGPRKQGEFWRAYESATRLAAQLEENRSVILARQFLEWASIESLDVPDELRERLTEDAMRVLCRFPEALSVEIVQGYLLLGRMAVARGAWDEAATRFENVAGFGSERLALVQPSLRAQAALARCRIELGEPERAEQALRRTWEGLRQRFGEGHAFTGQALAALVTFYDRTDEVERALPFLTVHLAQRSLKAAPGQLDRLAWDVVRFPDWERDLYGLALETAFEAVEKVPDRPEFRTTLGAALLRFGLFEDALRELEKAVTLSYGQNPRDWALLTLVHLARGDEKAARSSLLRMERMIEGASEPDILRLAHEVAVCAGFKSGA